MEQKFFEYGLEGLLCEKVPMKELAAKYGTPLYVYSASHLKERARDWQSALENCAHVACFAVKACSNLSVLKLLHAEGMGFDIVSGGELERVRAACGDTSRCVYAGVGKSEAEIRLALKCGILYFSVESEPELARIDRIAGEMGCKAPVSIRVNPDVDAHTHAYITTGKSENKFGLNFKASKELYLAMGKTYANVEAVGVQMHIGSQITEIKPYVMAVQKLSDFAGEIMQKGVALKYFDIGGGLGIVYSDETPASPKELAEAVMPMIAPLKLAFVCEMGRHICGNSAMLLTKVEYVKKNPDRNFVIVDAAMNDLMRPALYGARHEVEAVKGRGGEMMVCDLVGPVCESGDTFAKGLEIPAVKEGDLLVLKSAGAYGFSMASNYNTRNRVAEVLVEGSEARVVRRRETIEDQLNCEKEAL